MHDHNLSFLQIEIEEFVLFLKSECKLKIVFVENRFIERCLVNEFYPPDGNIYLNSYFIKKIDLDYAKILIKNEIYCLTQGISYEVNDFKENRYRNLWDYLNIVSLIESDIKVVRFLKSKSETLDFADYVRLYYKGHSTPSFDVLRLNAFDHFMGSMISINSYLKEQKMRYIVPRFSGNKLTMVIMDFERNHVDYLNIEINSFEIIKWKSMFQNSNNLSEIDYLETIIGLNGDINHKINHLFS